MVKKTSKKRIEPEFSNARADSSKNRESQSFKPSKKRKPSLSESFIRKEKKKDPLPQRRFRFSFLFLYWGLIVGLWVGVVCVGIAIYYGALMPSATSWAVPQRPPDIRILSSEGRLITNRGLTGGHALSLSEVSPFLKKAIVAIEDRRFYSHFGVDFLGILRAAIANLINGNSLQGGSTLTQQLAKNLFLTSERTLKRKIQEVFLSLWLEKKYKKDEILEMYLNRVYFGSGAYGVEAASRRYFSKSARTVNLTQAALLAGLLKAPSRLSPLRDLKAANDRARLVLLSMRDQNIIKKEEVEQALDSFPVLLNTHGNNAGDYVSDRIMEQIPFLVGEVDTDILVYTTIRFDLQEFAQNHIRSLLDIKGREFGVTQGALVCIDNTGSVRAMVGGKDYAASQFDRAFESRRQPGSAFKPFVFLSALEKGMIPETVRNDSPIRIGNWEPQNYNGKYYGPVMLSMALARSLNSVAVQLVKEVGVDSVIQVAKRLGIRSNLQINPSLALGTSEVSLFELTSAYIPFSNGGYRPEIDFIERIVTRSGKELYRARKKHPVRVINPAIAGMMNSMLSRTISEGTAKNADFGWPAGGKTGTSQKFRDAWFIGYTPVFTTGVWFGNDDGNSSKHASGGTLPVTAWRNFMEKAHKGISVKSFLKEKTQDTITDIIMRY